MKFLIVLVIVCWIVFSDAAVKRRRKRSTVSAKCDECYDLVDEECLPNNPKKISLADQAVIQCFEAHRKAQSQGISHFQFPPLSKKFELEDSDEYVECENEVWYEIDACNECEDLMDDPDEDNEEDAETEWDMWIDCCVKIYSGVDEDICEYLMD